jgi:hypothetical protein
MAYYWKNLKKTAPVTKQGRSFYVGGSTVYWMGKEETAATLTLNIMAENEKERLRKKRQRYHWGEYKLLNYAKNVGKKLRKASR